jgi:ABC-type tungstate transport system permease subunit
MSEEAVKTRGWLDHVPLLGLRPERTKSGVVIDVSVSGTTSVSSSALLDIARQHFEQMQDASGGPAKQKE